MQKASLLNLVLAFTSCTFVAGQVASPATSTLAPTQNASSSSGNVTSPTLNISGSYWTGSAAATDTWSIIDVLGTGSAPTSTLTFTHSAGAGVGSIAAPMFQATGSGAGAVVLYAGTAPVTPYALDAITLFAPTSVLLNGEYGIVLPDAPTVNGVLHWVVSGSGSTTLATESATYVNGTDCPTCLVTSTSPAAGDVLFGAGSQTPSATSTLQVGTAAPDVTVNQITNGDTMLLLKEVGSGSGNMLDLQASGAGHEFVLSQAGLITTYGASSVTAQGVPSISSVSNSPTNTGTFNGTLTIPAAGEYRISYYANQHALCASGNGIVTIQFSWTDQSGASRQTASGTHPASPTMPIYSAANNAAFTAGDFYISTDSGSVTFPASISSACTTGTPSYDIYASAERVQ